MGEMGEGGMQFGAPPQWRCAGDAPGAYFPFDAGTAAMFEQALPTKSPVTWQSRGFGYYLDWNTMEQVNTMNQKRRGIERVVGGKVTHPSASRKKIMVQVPNGAFPGMAIQIKTPEGQMLKVTVPQGAGPGMNFAVEY